MDFLNDWYLKSKLATLVVIFLLTIFIAKATMTMVYAYKGVGRGAVTPPGI